MNEEMRAVLLDIIQNTELLDKVSVTLNPLTRDVVITYEDLDDEWFKELEVAKVSA